VASRALPWSPNGYVGEPLSADNHMVASGAHGSGSGQNGRRVDALRDIKEAEREIQDQKERAREEAEQIVEQARREANQHLEDAIEDAEREAEDRVTEAREEAEERADELLEEAEREAEDLRNVSETQLDEAAEAVIDRFKARVGGS